MPLSELAVSTAVLTRADAAAGQRDLVRDPAAFALHARQAALAQAEGGGVQDYSPTGQGQRRLLLVIDQFEQLFTQCDSEEERRAFVTALHAAATVGQGPRQVPAALVVLVVRADFEAQCASYEDLGDAVQDRYLLTPMTQVQMRLAITGPARVAGSSVDDDLVSTLLSEMDAAHSSAGSLPLLSYALDQAWRSRAGDVLTLADYERTGGIEGAIATSAERAYASLTSAQQETARHVFLRLTTTSDNGADTSRQASRAELTEGKTAAEAENVQAVLEAFTAPRLLTLTADGVEISHEVLLAVWPRLRDAWLADSLAYRITFAQLRDAAANWERNTRDSAHLYRGTLLQAAEATAHRASADPARYPPLTHAERDFLQASRNAMRRAARIRRTAIVGLVTLVLAAAASAGIAVHAESNSAQQNVIALSGQLAADSLVANQTDPLTARQLAVAAWSVYPTTQAGSAMTILLAEQQRKSLLVAPGPQQSVKAVAFSPNGQLLAAAYSNGTIRLWDPATGQLTITLSQSATHAPGAVNSVAFSPDGQLLAAAYSNGTIQLWDVATGRQIGAPLTGQTGAVNSVAFSPDGKTIAVGDGGGSVTLWDETDPTSPRLLKVLPTSDNAVNSVAFSGDGKLVASAYSNGTIRLWDPSTGRLAGAPLSAQTGASVNGVAFSPDGKLLTTAGSNGATRLWRVALFTNPYGTLCTDTRSLTLQEWDTYAPGEPFPKICALSIRFFLVIERREGAVMAILRTASGTVGHPREPP